MSLLSRTTAVAVVVVLSSIDVAARVSRTLATVPGFTVTVDVVVLPSLVAVMVAVPATPPVTSTLGPVVADRLAIVGSLVCQVTTRSVSALPSASFGVAVRMVVLFCTIDGLVLSISTDATGTGVIVMVADPDLPSEVAVAVAAPTASPVTSPVVALMLANALPDVMLHVTVRSVTTTPRVSLTVATSVIFSPTLRFAAATVTLCTGALVTVTADDPVTPSTVA